jgi:hypothetical protein
MIRAIVAGAVIVSVVFSGGASADVSLDGLKVTLKRADGHVVTGLVNNATEIRCGARRCDRASLRTGAIVLRAELRRSPAHGRLFRTLVIERARRPA